MSSPNEKSEPRTRRNPRKQSEPAKGRNPQQKSEPSSGSKPKAISEPFCVSNPIIPSEPYHMSNPKEKSEMTTVQDLQMLEYLRITFQRHRIQMTNRVAATERGDSELPSATAERYAARFAELENDVRVDIAGAIKDHEMWPWLHAVKGIGAGLAGCIVAPVDIERADTVSALWRYAGQGVNGDGKADRRTKGEKLAFNADLKRTMYLVGTSFLRGNSPYRMEYDEAKAMYTEHRPGWTLGHCDMAARRKMVKLFLSHLWLLWRHERGLPMNRPYPHQHLNHDGVKPPWRYVPDYEYPHDVREHYKRMAATMTTDSTSNPERMSEPQP